MKPISIGAKLLLVYHQQKQYGVLSQNELTRRVYRNFGTFPSARVNRCFGNKKNKIFSLFWKEILVNFVKISPLNHTEKFCLWRKLISCAKIFVIAKICAKFLSVEKLCRNYAKSPQIIRKSRLRCQLCSILMINLLTGV